MRFKRLNYSFLLCAEKSITHKTSICKPLCAAKIKSQEKFSILNRPAGRVTALRAVFLLFSAGRSDRIDFKPCRGLKFEYSTSLPATKFKVILLLQLRRHDNYVLTVFIENDAILRKRYLYLDVFRFGAGKFYLHVAVL